MRSRACCRRLRRQLERPLSRVSFRILRLPSLAKLSEARAIYACQGQHRGRQREKRLLEREKGMPIYEFQCPKCNKVFEEWCAHISEDHHQEPCPDCGTISPRIISNTSFVLEGGGWYVTDYGYRKGIKDEDSSPHSSTASSSSDAAAASDKGADAGSKADSGTKAAATDSAAPAPKSTASAPGTSGTSSPAASASE